MAIVKNRKVGKQTYYYAEHSFKAGNKVKTLSKYLGKKIPADIEDIKYDLEFLALRSATLDKIKNIKINYQKDYNNLPDSEKQKLIEDFLVHFIYDSSKIEGSSLSLNDTRGLFLHN